MKIIALNKIIIAAVFVASFTSCVPEEAESQGAIVVTEATPVRWNSSAFNGGGLNFKIADDLVNSFVATDLDSDGDDPIEQMMKEWNAVSSDVDFFRVSATTTTNKDKSSVESYLDDNELGIYRSDTWIPGVDSRALAITAYKAFHRNAGTSSHFLEVVHADIIINFRDYDFTVDEDDGFFYDLPSVMLHELGHAIGLKHVSNSTNSVMNSSIGRSDVNRELSNYDKTTVKSLYGLSNSGVGPLAASAQSVKTKRVLPQDARESADGSVVGIIELRADGECRHYLDGKLTHSHR